jgi:hypothetical protein
MGPRALAAPARPDDSDKPIRDHLARVLGSATFQPVDRLKRFLAFIAHEALAGRSDQLKEYVIGVFDPLRGDKRFDSIARQLGVE